MRARARASSIAVLATVVLWLAAFGCKKDKESLLVVTLSAGATDATAMNMTSVVLTVSDGTHALSRTFPLTAGTGIPSTSPFVTFGVYIDSDITGGVTVSAKASQTGSCVGESGSKAAKIAMAGDTTPITLAMKPDADVCPVDGGATGAAGATGAGGSSGGSGSAGQTGSCGPTGSGGRPAIVAAPSFSSCVSTSGYDAPGTLCDTVNDVNNPAIGAVAFSPDGHFVATGGVNSDDSDDHVRIWTFDGTTLTPCGPSLSTFGYPYLAFSPDGHTLAVGSSYDYVYLYDVPSWTLLRTLTSVGSDFLTGVGFTPDSKMVITLGFDSLGGGDVYIDGVDGTAYTSLALGRDADLLAVSPVASGNSVNFAVTDYNGGVGVYAVTMGSSPTVTSTASVSQNTVDVPVYSAAFSADGSLLAAGSQEGTVVFWTISPQGAAQPNGAIITANDSSTFMNGLSFSPDGASIAVAVGGDTTKANLYGVTSRTLQAGFTAPNFVESIAFAPSQGAVVAGEFSCGQVLLCIH
jgi:WD domain, G-beta repeat